jgi:hypothetical protein
MSHVTKEVSQAQHLLASTHLPDFKYKMGEASRSNMKRKEPYYFDCVVFQVRKCILRVTTLRGLTKGEGGGCSIQTAKEPFLSFQCVRYDIYLAVRRKGCGRHR